MKSQASEALNPKSLQSQNRLRQKFESPIKPLEVLHGRLDTDALAALGGLINAIKEAKADGCEPGTVFAWVEEDLRARMAVPVEKSLDRADNDERQAANNRNGDERASR